MDTTIFGEKQDRYFMGVALEQAHEAYMAEEVPVGAVVVNADGVIIAQAYNAVETLHTQRAHAEMIVLEQAAHLFKNWRLMGCWLYVTLEPCTMCMGLARLSRIAGIVYGAASPLFGYRSRCEIDNYNDFLINNEKNNPVDKEDRLRLYKRDTLMVISGVEGEKSELLLKKFFHKKRIEKSG